MNISYPHTIENCIGEKIVFKGLEAGPGGDKLIADSYTMPGIGPIMHTHLLQDECFTVVSGRIGYQVQGQPEQFAGEGETVLFKRGVPHRFWNAGEQVLHCKGWVQPANTFPFFISTVFAAQNKTGSARPELFDTAYLLTRYSSEYRLQGIPWFVRKVIIPITYLIGRLSGKYSHFKDAPEAIGNKQ